MSEKFTRMTGLHAENGDHSTTFSVGPFPANEPFIEQ